MGKLLLKSLVFLTIASTCHAASLHKQIKVAIIDTGIDVALMDKKFICRDGHKDFTNTGLMDRHGHGTHISGIIDQNVKNIMLSVSTLAKLDSTIANYCQIIIKYYDPTAPNLDNLANTIAAFRWAISQNVDVINYSGGGLEPSVEEKQVIEEALDKGIKIVAAAGNERNDLAARPYYPAMYDKRIYIVGNLINHKMFKKIQKKTNSRRNIAGSSDYGNSVNTWEIGTEVLSRVPGGKIRTMTGTSQATAVKSGKLVREMLNH